MLCPVLCSALSRHLIFPESPCETGGFVPFPQTALSAPVRNMEVVCSRRTKETAFSGTRTGCPWSPGLAACGHGKPGVRVGGRAASTDKSLVSQAISGLGHCCLSCEFLYIQLKPYLVISVQIHLAHWFYLFQVRSESARVNQ